eukprot:1151243-Pelagomonas_calceolata.AAC.1
MTRGNLCFICPQPSVESALSVLCSHVLQCGSVEQQPDWGNVSVGISLFIRGPWRGCGPWCLGTDRITGALA